MTIPRILLLLLAILFLVILIFSGNRLSAGFSQRFFSVFPIGQKTTPTPTGGIRSFNTLTTPKPTAAQQTTKGDVAGVQTPATGPAETSLALLGGGLGLGYLLRRYRLRG